MLDALQFIIVCILGGWLACRIAAPDGKDGGA